MNKQYVSYFYYFVILCIFFESLKTFFRLYITHGENNRKLNYKITQYSQRQEGGASQASVSPHVRVSMDPVSV